MSEARKRSRDRRREFRQKATQCEMIMWKELRQLRKYNLKFRRQHNIGWYIADFYCPSARLVIEIDGPVHDSVERKGYDTERTSYLEARGYKVLRFRNEEVVGETDAVIKVILHSIQANKTPFAH